MRFLCYWNHQLTKLGENKVFIIIKLDKLERKQILKKRFVALNYEIQQMSLIPPYLPMKLK